MSKRTVDLTDPYCEPSDEEMQELLQSVGDKIRAQSERMAKERKQIVSNEDESIF